MNERKWMRFISLCVLCCFSLSLGAPIIRAQQASGSTAAVVEGAQSGLSHLWFGWKDMIAKAIKPTMDQASAIKWFQTKGATPQQASLLAANAAAEGHLVTQLPVAGQQSAAAATTSGGGNVVTNFWNKITGKTAAVTVDPGQALVAKLKTAATGSTPAGNAPSFLKGSPLTQNGVTQNAVNVKITPQEVAAGVGSYADKAKAAVMGQPAPVQPQGFFAKFTQGVKNVGSTITNGVKKVGATVKKGAQKVALTGKRAVNDTATVARTGVYTVTDKLAFWNKYYKIPVTESLGIKVQGKLSYTTKFTDGAWVVDKYSSVTNMPGKGEAANALFSVEQASASVQPQNMGFFQKIASKIKSGWTSVKNGISGHRKLTPEAKAEVGKIQIENGLLEKARTLNEVSSSIEQRISNLETSAKAMKRPVNSEEIKALRDTQKYVNEQKEVLKRQLNEVHQGKAMTIVKDAAKWALYGVGITAGVNIAKQIFSGEGIDLKAAFSFMGQPQFWGGMAGGFAGSMAGNYLGSMLMGSIVGGLPGGVGMFARLIPGFLGAALGFEFGGSLFGGQMDLLGATVQSLASAGGWTLASMLYTSLMGAAAPGIVLMAAAIGSSMLANWLLNKFRGGPVAEAQDLLPVDPIVPPMLSDTDATVSEQTVVDAPQTAMSLAELKQARADAYTRYINLLKDRKIVEARDARADYEQYDQALKDQVDANVN